MKNVTNKRLVIKVGTSTLTHETGRLNLRNLDRLARTLSDLEGMGHEVILVSSGAIGVAPPSWGWPSAPPSCGRSRPRRRWASAC